MSESRECPSCGAPLPDRATRCSYCGAAIHDETLEEETREACRTFLQAMTGDLEEVATPLVVVGFILASLSIPAAYLVAKTLGAAPWERVAATVFVGLAAMVGAGLVLVREEGRRFRRVLRPQIGTFLAEHEVSRDEVLAAAWGTLKKNSDLMKFLDDLYGGNRRVEACVGTARG